MREERLGAGDAAPERGGELRSLRRALEVAPELAGADHLKRAHAKGDPTGTGRSAGEAEAKGSEGQLRGNTPSRRRQVLRGWLSVGCESVAPVRLYRAPPARAAGRTRLRTRERKSRSEMSAWGSLWFQYGAGNDNEEGIVRALADSCDFKRSDARRQRRLHNCVRRRLLAESRQCVRGACTEA